MSFEDGEYCSCCGYRTIGSEHAICVICGWEEDWYQAMNPDDDNGGTGMSLREAQKNFLTTGTVSPHYISRIPKPEKPEQYFERDPNWKPLPQTMP